MISELDSFRGKESIIESLKPLARELTHVRIDCDVLETFCSSLSRRHFPVPRWDQSFIYSKLDESGVDYFMLMNSLNFCYWGTPKWSVEYGGRRRDGAWGMFAALKRAIEEGIPIWDGEFLAGMTTADLSGIFRGNIQIPLFSRRLDICREVGRGLVKHFQGRFHNLVREAGGSAVRVAHFLVSYFPSFDDSADWEGEKLLFYKRAQLAPAMLFERWAGRGAGFFSDIGDLTVSADYKIPQVLRRIGILRYSPRLAGIVDSGRIIPVNSREELEIRLTTIVAGELMLEQLKPRVPDVTSQAIDRMLWLVGQKKSEGDKPYHRTQTIAY